MALVHADNIKETSTTSGTGTLTLLGAEIGFQTFVAGVGDGLLTSYAVFAVAGDGTRTGLWETGYGIVTDAGSDTLSRLVVVDGSSGKGVAVSFASDTKVVICTLLGQALGGGCKIQRSTNQTIANNTATTVEFDTGNVVTKWDVGDFHDPATNSGQRIVIPAGYDGKYLVVGEATWASNGTGFRQILLNHLDSGLTGKDLAVQLIDTATANTHRHTLVAVFDAVATDIFLFKVRHLAGGTLDLVGASGAAAVAPRFSAWRIGP